MRAEMTDAQQAGEMAEMKAALKDEMTAVTRAEKLAVMRAHY